MITFTWWAGVDSNHRSRWRQIYSLFPLAAREPFHDWAKAILELVMGLEPATCWLQISCSASWATPAKCFIKLGASGRNRTTDTGIFSPLLYLLSYRGIQVILLKMLVNDLQAFLWRPGRGSNPRPPAWQAGVLTICTTGPNINWLSGGPSRTRTADQSVMSRPL